MEETTEVVDRSIFLKTKAKDEQKFIKWTLKHSHWTKEEKLTHLKTKLQITEEETQEILDFLGLSLQESQFSAIRSHTLQSKKRYIISSAQNSSPVNDAFLDNIKAYANFIDAEIGIIATRYKNPTSTFNEKDDVWDQKVHPYLTAHNQFLHPYVFLAANHKVQATSPNPTNGIESYGDEASVIVGAPRIEMRTVSVLPLEKQKFLYSTGSVTDPNFTDSVAGSKAKEHHSYGFVIVEIEDEHVVHLRSVSASPDGSFNDLIHRIEDKKVTVEDVECLVWGDSHFAQKDPVVTEAFRTLCSDLGVTESILHDVWDSKSINVHNFKNPIVQHQLMKSGQDDLKAELKGMKEELKWFERNMTSTYVVASNHDDMLDRAMYQSDWTKNIKNAEIFTKLLSLSLSGKAPNGLIPYKINKKFASITALGLNDSYVKYGVELALHGHKGPNGSRGNIQAFAKLSKKTIIGHSHSPGIRWGCYQVGLSCRMDHGYNNGLSSWAYAGCTLNHHGKRQLIVLNRDTLTYTTLY